ncbi:MAG: hypothetical protein U0841_20950, partial [Chloroflexia bacterium]
YIRVGEDTTREQLLRDFRSIKNQQEARVKAGRPPRDPLLALQVAILVKNDWTEAQLAERYGWALGEDDYGKPRCDTARYFARLGREQLVRARSNIE